ncbi:hypothetical protein FF2_039646 [Malus domestica]
MSVSEENANIRDHHRRLLAAKYELTTAACWRRNTSCDGTCTRPSARTQAFPAICGRRTASSSPSYPVTAPSRASGTAASSPAAHAPSTRPSVCPVSFSVLLPPKACSMA